MNHEVDDRNRDDVDAARIEALAGHGLALAEIANVLAISEEALASHHAASIERGHTRSTARVAESLFRKATGEGHGAVTAAIFWLKTRARWRETSGTELMSAGRALVTSKIRRFAEDARDGRRGS